MNYIAFTGHRPQDLAGIHPDQFEHTLDQLGVGTRLDVTFITGGALGVDTWAAHYAIGRHIPFELHLPFNPEVMGRFWTADDRAALAFLVYKTKKLVVIGSDRYDKSLYQRRNESMVDAATQLFAVWNGKPYGGTYNCLRYAMQKGTPTYNMFPFNGKIRPIKEV